MWYAVYTKSQFEKKIEEELESKGVEVFLPTIKELRQWTDRKKWVTIPMFKNYLFVNIDFKDRFKVLQCNGVVKIVSFNNKPIAIPDEQINSLKLILKKPDKVKVEPYINIGEEVIVTGGFFKGVRGIITKQLGSNNVVITLESINQSVSVIVEPELIKVLKK